MKFKIKDVKENKVTRKLKKESSILEIKEIDFKNGVKFFLVKKEKNKGKNKSLNNIIYLNNISKSNIIFEIEINEYRPLKLKTDLDEEKLDLIRALTIKGIIPRIRF